MVADEAGGQRRAKKATYFRRAGATRDKRSEVAVSGISETCHGIFERKRARTVIGTMAKRILSWFVK
jgi:hypothetical protein